ncbi:hypothetical protein HXS80_16030 [Streptomyces sp. CB04723]|nr:hypothetical protein HXS80_16030 [Streptomyces sp. CB04723]
MHIGKLVTDGKRTGVLRDVDLRWVDPRSDPNDRRTYPQAWVYFEGRGEMQVSPGGFAPV